MKNLSENEALLRLSALCSSGEHCTFELLEKMRRWQLSEEQQASVMAYLENHHFVDDERFARAFALDKIRYNKWGRRKVEQALWAKHIDEAIRRRVLDEIDEAEYIKVLRPLLKSRKRSTKAASDYELNMKLMRFALGRGFAADQIRACLDGAGDMDMTDEDSFLE